MIHEIDESLRRLLAPAVTGDIAFDAPTRDWAARRNSPTLNAYLYDIREDVARRERGAYAERDAHGIVTRRRQPPRWFRLSYLVTAWTARPEDEHRLLSGALALLLPHEVLTGDAVPESVRPITESLPLAVAMPPAESRSLADIWSALGGELKPSLDVVISTPFPVTPVYEVAPPVTEGELHVRGIDGRPDDSRPRMMRRSVTTMSTPGTAKGARTEGGR
ncbi:hypothetical protein AQF52_7630 [Streptomyces venezuelae]|uniref:DUF4255 domain-containing protein n=1 Tax=Streptomyces gardneri TaxID=66892 RepID=UPI0006BCE452|nr:DUF4255 domain-containing protein [Streptomyces gardneri]ALO13216.1 hypothetical protein AQF52_7630 [Streptomyces venezuelae]QPK49879.1 DUF4255 domain-containing protein [Streptomyces gardneri]WRK41445.1 DUF4255 domain-containing protein [Streptomyces venezuelae]CUM36101.1 FIG01123036: hypothetical protein [Streptomyces venezuelae]